MGAKSRTYRVLSGPYVTCIMYPHTCWLFMLPPVGSQCCYLVYPHAGTFPRVPESSRELSGELQRISPIWVGLPSNPIPFLDLWGPRAGPIGSWLAHMSHAYVLCTYVPMSITHIPALSPSESSREFLRTLQRTPDNTLYLGGITQ